MLHLTSFGIAKAGFQRVVNFRKSAENGSELVLRELTTSLFVERH